MTLAEMLPAARKLSPSEKLKLIRILAEDLEYVAIARPKYYPLLGMPITIADDFDEPIPELWEALN
jgi:hypothetical protein